MYFKNTSQQKLPRWAAIEVCKGNLSEEKCFCKSKNSKVLNAAETMQCHPSSMFTGLVPSKICFWQAIVCWYRGGWDQLLLVST